jgi:hypothetical protein
MSIYPQFRKEEENFSIWSLNPEAYKIEAKFKSWDLEWTYVNFFFCIERYKEK